MVKVVVVVLCWSYSYCRRSFFYKDFVLCRIAPCCILCPHPEKEMCFVWGEGRLFKEHSAVAKSHHKNTMNRCVYI